MSTDTQVLGLPPVVAGTPLTMKAVTELLIKHYGFHDGKFDLLVEYQFAAGAFGPTVESVNPGIMVGIAKLGLAQAVHSGALTVDAAEVNPAPRAKTRKASNRRPSSRAA